MLPRLGTRALETEGSLVSVALRGPLISKSPWALHFQRSCLLKSGQMPALACVNKALHLTLVLQSCRPFRVRGTRQSPVLATPPAGPPRACATAAPGAGLMEPDCLSLSLRQGPEFSREDRVASEHRAPSGPPHSGP